MIKWNIMKCNRIEKWNRIICSSGIEESWLEQNVKDKLEWSSSKNRVKQNGTEKIRIRWERKENIQE